MPSGLAAGPTGVNNFRPSAVDRFPRQQPITPGLPTPAPLTPPRSNGPQALPLSAVCPDSETRPIRPHPSHSRRATPYVIRVKDPDTGVSRPRWVGGFASEEAAKAARDQARVQAHRGEYIDRNSITVSAYFSDWIENHAMEIKPRTLADYRSCIRLYVTPRIGKMPIQTVRPSTITKLYRDLLSNGGYDGKPLAVSTVTHLLYMRCCERPSVMQSSWTN